MTSYGCLPKDKNGYMRIPASEDVDDNSSTSDELEITARYRTSKKKLLIKCGSIVSFVFISAAVILTWYLTKIYNTQSCKSVYPGAPNYLDVYNVTGSELWCQWDRPNYPNLTIAGYKVDLEDQKGHEIKTITTNKNQYTFRELEPWTWYTVSVSAYTLSDACVSDALYGPKQTASARTSVIDTQFCKIGDQGMRVCFVGVQKNCDSSVKYCNGPLQPSTQYWAKVRAYTDYGWTETYPVTFNTTKKASSAGNLKPSVMMCALVILISFLWKRTTL